MIYADNAATTKMSERAKKVMLETADNFWENPSSLHSPGQKAAERLYKVREDIAKIIGADPGEIYLTSGGSEADNQALLTAAKIGRRRKKMHIISTAIEHHAILHALDALKNEGFEITLVPVDEFGRVSPEDIKNAIKDDTVMVSVMFANNEIGTIEPIEEIAAVCKEKGVLFHTDAVQAAGHLKIDVKKMQIDMLSVSAHKFHGPKGVGFLYARKGIDLANVIYGGAQEKGKRGGTENLPAAAGMAEALAESYENLEEKTAKTRKVRDRIIKGLSEIPHSALNGDPENRLCGNINFCFEGIEGESLLLLLDAKGIAASSGSACTSGSLDPSHVLLAIGRPHEVAHGSLRLSITEETTVEDADYIINATKEVVSYLRDISPVYKELERGEKKYVIQ